MLSILTFVESNCSESLLNVSVFSIYSILFVEGEKEYYEKQFATLKSFDEVDAIVSSDGIDEENLEEQIQQERAMKISNYANILLLAFKVSSNCLFEC